MKRDPDSPEVYGGKIYVKKKERRIVGVETLVSASIVLARKNLELLKLIGVDGYDAQELGIVTLLGTRYDRVREKTEIQLLFRFKEVPNRRFFDFLVGPVFGGERTLEISGNEIIAGLDSPRLIVTVLMSAPLRNPARFLHWRSVMLAKYFFNVVIESTKIDREPKQARHAGCGREVLS